MRKRALLGPKERPIEGIVNKHLVPMVPVSIRTKDNGWQEFKLLVDTGFNGEIMLEPELLDRYNLATRPDHRSMTPETILKSEENWEPQAPYKGAIKWKGQEQTTGIRLVPGSLVDGMLGTALLKCQRLTVDVIEGGTASIRHIPRRSFWIIRRRSARKVKTVPTFGGDLWEPLRWSCSYFPWTKLKVQDSEGQYTPLWVNVDTGDSEELSLPTRMITRFGMKASGKSRIHTTKGCEEVDCGNVNVIWQGEELIVKWRQRSDEHPPLVGMKLFRGTRITVDFDQSIPIADIRRIPEPPRSVWGILGSLRKHPRS